MSQERKEKATMLVKMQMQVQMEEEYLIFCVISHVLEISGPSSLPPLSTSAILHMLSSHWSICFLSVP